MAVPRPTHLVFIRGGGLGWGNIYPSPLKEGKGSRKKSSATKRGGWGWGVSLGPQRAEKLHLVKETYCKGNKRKGKLLLIHVLVVG